MHAKEEVDLNDSMVQVNSTKDTKIEPETDAAYRISIKEGARDLAVVQALLESSRQASKTVSVHSVP